MKTPHQHILILVVVRILPHMSTRGTRNRVTRLQFLGIGPKGHRRDVINLSLLGAWARRSFSP